MNVLWSVGKYLLSTAVSFLSGFLVSCGVDSSQLHVVIVLPVSLPGIVQEPSPCPGFI